MRIASIGHATFAATLIALGILGLVNGDFAPIWQGVPKGLPAREALAYLRAVVSLVCGMGLVWRRTATTAARVLLAYLVLWLLLLRLPDTFPVPAVLGSWYGCAETAAILAGAWVLYAWFAANRDRRRATIGRPSSHPMAAADAGRLAVDMPLRPHRISGRFPRPQFVYATHRDRR